MVNLDDTIVAIASPPGGAARGIVRLSGPQARACAESCFRMADGGALPSTAVPMAFSGALHLPELPGSLPADVLIWPGSRSYTRQSVAEIHTLGSPPLLQALLRAMCTAGARLAGPGEFTLRAFLSGRIDLTQAEAVLGVIDAAGAEELKVALTQLAGGLATPLHGLRGTLLNLLAELEAGLDFAEEDVAFISREELSRQLADAEQSAAAIVQQMASRGESRETVRAVLVGRPNTGKSSLFNALAGQAQAIVSDHPGTTRDYLVAALSFDGVQCDLIDTAGVLPTEAPTVADQAAQSVAAEQHFAAHVQLLCIDSTRPLDPWERNELARSDPRRITVLTKCDAPRQTGDCPDFCGRTPQKWDCPPWDQPPDTEIGTGPQTDCSYPALETSSRRGDGLVALRGELRRAVFAASGQTGEVVAATAARCSASLHMALECLHRARAIASSSGLSGGEEFVAAEIRESLTELGKVVGDIHTEDVLERIFSRFCVGK